MKTPEEVKALTDRRERLATATDLHRKAREKRKKALALRDMAAIVANADHGVDPVVLYRGMKMSRGLLNRILQRTPVAEKRPTMADPVRTAIKAAEDVRTWRAQEKAYRDLRDATAIAMMNGVGDDGDRVPPVPNAEVARITGLTTARVAQLRTGNA